MSKTIVYAVHGFLGRGSDWDQVKVKLKNVEFKSEDMFSADIDTDIFRNVELLNSQKRKKIFLGYSLGGRLGLQILKKNPNSFEHYVFLSTNPGLADDATEARKNRLMQDINWSKKITSENYHSFLIEWNSQEVFSGSTQEPERKIEDYDLQKLKIALTDWSLALQPDYSELIRNHRNKITWVVGEHDSKYCQIAQDLKNKMCLDEFLKVGAGHRILLDNPMSVVSILNKLFGSSH